MMEKSSRTNNLAVIAGVAAVAAALGFGGARWLAPAARTVPAPMAKAAAAGEAAAAEVKIPAEYLAAAGIAVEAVASGTPDAEILTAGTVVAQPNSEAAIVPRASGTIIRVDRQLGDTVRAGDVLALVESPEATAMAAERSTANARAELARKNFERENSLFAQGVTARQDMEAAQSALAVAQSEAQRASSVAQAAHVSADGKSLAVVSPIAGRITALNATLGAYVGPQAELFRVAGAAAPLVQASLPAADVGRVAVGDKATILAEGGVPLSATVRSVTPTANASTRAATVVLTPATPARQLVIGAGVQARLHAGKGAPGMVVPEEAVQNVDGRDVLFVRTGDGFRVQPVLVGGRSHGMAQIVSGVRAGERVATRNAFLVKADMIKSAGGEE